MTVPGQRWVVKVGSGVLAANDGTLRVDRVQSIARQVAALRAAGHQVVVVSSGAVASGFRHLGFEQPPSDLPDRQACASVGQFYLVSAYEHVFAEHGTTAGLVLLTHDDINDRHRYLHARNTIDTLLRRGAVPIVNENDAVAVEEILMGDNDQLAALVAAFVEADRLVLLTNVRGVWPAGADWREGDPLPEIADPEGFADTLDGSGSLLGRGGMRGKLLAAAKAAGYGIPAWIASGAEADTLLRLASDAPRVGTYVPPVARPMNARRFWIRFVTRPRGDIEVDAGAVRAIAEQGRSLLPKGIRGVTGSFASGGAVRVIGPDGAVVARGLASYDHEELRRIAGRHSDEIEAVLGYRRGDAAIHRNDLVLERAMPPVAPAAQAAADLKSGGDS